MANPKAKTAMKAPSKGGNFGRSGPMTRPASKTGQPGGTQGPGKGYSNRIAKRGYNPRGYHPEDSAQAPAPKTTILGQRGQSNISAAVAGGANRKKGVLRP